MKMATWCKMLLVRISKTMPQLGETDISVIYSKSIMHPSILNLIECLKSLVRVKSHHRGPVLSIGSSATAIFAVLLYLSYIFAPSCSGWLVIGVCCKCSNHLELSPFFIFKGILLCISNIHFFILILIIPFQALILLLLLLLMMVCTRLI